MVRRFSAAILRLRQKLSHLDGQARQKLSHLDGQAGLIIFFVAVLIRLIKIDQSLWLDEAVSVLTARDLSLRGLWDHYRSAHFQPPLHSFVLSFWGKLFGYSEISMRLPSVLAGAGTAWLAWHHCSEAGKKKLARRWGWLLALAPFSVYYSQEARPYALALFFVTGWMLSLGRLLTGREKKWGPFFIWGALSVWSGYYNLLIVPVQWIVSWGMKKKKDFQKRLLVGQFFVGVSFLPWLPNFLFQLKAGAASLVSLPGWGQMVGLATVKILPVTLIKFFFGRITFFNKTLYAGLALGLFVLFSWLVIDGVKKKKITKLSLAWLLIPLGLVWLASIWVPNYQPFRILLVLPAFYLVLALASLGKNWVWGGLVLISLFGLVRYWTNPYFQREDWRGLVGWVDQEGIELVLLPSETSRWPLDYYEVDSEVRGASSGLNQVDHVFLTQNMDLPEKIFYLRYLVPVFDQQELIPAILEKYGFAKIQPVVFNQLEGEVWERR